MIVIVTLTVGLVIWVAGWAFGLKAFDVFLLTTLMVVTAAAVRMVHPFVDKALGRQRTSPGDGLGPPTAPGTQGP